MRDLLLGFKRVRVFGFLVLLASCQFLNGAPAASWSNVPDLPTELVRATGVYFPANGCFYAMGGRMSDTVGADMTTPYEYNPRTNTWIFKTAPFPDNQVNNMACGVLSEGGTPYIYCVGGIASVVSGTTRRVFRYNPIADTIQSTGIDPWNESVAETLPGGFAIVQNKLYILGGFTGGLGATNRIFEFTPGNPVGSQWSQKAATLPVALSFVPATAIGNMIYTAGGSTFAPCNLTETTNSYAYDPAKDSISTMTGIPRATAETQAVTVNDEMWVLGGGRAAPNPSPEVNIYNPLTGQWRLGLPLSTGLRNFAAASDGVRVLVTGGYNSSAIKVKTAEIYGPAARRGE